MKQSELIKERLRNVMACDRVAGIEKLITILKSDFLQILKNYMYIDINEIEIEMETNADGGYTLSMLAKTDHLIDPGKMIE